jgi:hypothetical protein
LKKKKKTYLNIIPCITGPWFINHVDVLPVLAQKFAFSMKMGEWSKGWVTDEVLNVIHRLSPLKCYILGTLRPVDG